jgi:hypothetical protein
MVRVAAMATTENPAHTARTRPGLPGKLDPEQAEREARSKIMWGDDPAEVSKLLRAHGFSAEEADAVITPLLLERRVSVRKAGMNKIFQGIGMMCLPVVGWFFFKAAGYLPPNIRVHGGSWNLGRIPRIDRSDNVCDTEGGKRRRGRYVVRLRESNYHRRRFLNFFERSFRPSAYLIIQAALKLECRCGSRNDPRKNGIEADPLF